MGMPLAYNVWAAEAVKKKIALPLIASGSINLPALAESILVEGKGDFIARAPNVGRRRMGKAVEGRPEDIRPCIRCNDGCLARGDHAAKTISCSVNVAVCREDEFRITKAETPKKVAVVGGGPAGMEAAGLLLKGLVGGGGGGGGNTRSVSWAAPCWKPRSPSSRRPTSRAADRLLQDQIAKLGVAVLHEEATVAGLKNAGFDAVIVAAGASPLLAGRRLWHRRSQGGHRFTGAAPGSHSRSEGGSHRRGDRGHRGRPRPC